MLTNEQARIVADLRKGAEGAIVGLPDDVRATQLVNVKAADVLALCDAAGIETLDSALIGTGNCSMANAFVDTGREIGNAVLAMLGVTDQNITRFSLHCSFQGEVPTLEIERVCDAMNGIKQTKRYQIKEIDE